MTDHEAIARVERYACKGEGLLSVYCANNEDDTGLFYADLRLLLDLAKQVGGLREALEQSTVTLRMLKRNVETEIKFHDGLFRWEGVPDAIQYRIDQSSSALRQSKETGE